MAKPQNHRSGLLVATSLPTFVKNIFVDVTFVVMRKLLSILNHECHEIDHSMLGCVDGYNHSMNHTYHMCIHILECFNHSSKINTLKE